MKLKRLKPTFSICKVEDYTQVDLSKPYVFIAKTEYENSLVCESSLVPSNTTHQDDEWSAFYIVGTLDFSLIGILSKISTILAQHNIGIFVVSSYDTDYILTKSKDIDTALEVLQKEGYIIEK